MGIPSTTAIRRSRGGSRCGRDLEGDEKSELAPDLNFFTRNDLLSAQGTTTTESAGPASGRGQESSV